MLSEEIISYVEREAVAGQEELARLVRSLVADRAPHIVEALEGHGNDALMEPSVFAWLTGRRTDLDAAQIFYGVLLRDQRPRHVPVRTGPSGTAYFPRCGEVFGLEPEACLSLITKISGSGEMAAFEDFRPAHWLQSRALELTCRLDPLVAPILGGAECLAGTEAYTLATHLEGALSRFARLAPSLYALLLRANRRVHIYRAPQPNSFATLSVHGCAFLNTPVDAGEIHFLDDFAHQGGHVVFNAATHEQARYLRVPGATALTTLGAKDDSRSLYAAFHGLFTYSAILTVLSRAWDETSPHEGPHHELRGRIAFYLVKFHSDLDLLRAARLYAPAGTYLYEGFRDCFERVRDRYYPAIADVDLTAQPYVFSPTVYAQHNPVRMSS